MTAMNTNSFQSRLFGKASVAGVVDSDSKGKSHAIVYIVIAALLGLVALAVMQWGIVALAMGALAMVPVVMITLIVITVGK